LVAADNNMTKQLGESQFTLLPNHMNRAKCTVADGSKANKCRAARGLDHAHTLIGLADEPVV
jgi:hypothetical protein